MKDLIAHLDDNEELSSTLKHVAWETGHGVSAALCSCGDDYHLNAGHKPLYEIVTGE